jgi:SAM-dependent methyltransferase
MNAGYNILPAVYDRWQSTYGRSFSEMVFPRLLAALRAHRIPVTSMVDVACGTGTLAVLMARRGWEVYGIDASEGMIARASAKAVAMRAPGAVFLQQDMRSFRLPRQVGLATSFFDSLNHLLTHDDLLAAYRCVRETLVPGGWFVFDLNNEQCYTQLWTRSDSVTHDEFTMTLENSYDRKERVATSHVTVQMKEGNGEQRTTETVRERFYPLEEVRALLVEAGFSVRESRDFNFTHNPGMGKVKTWFVAERE